MDGAFNCVVDVCWGDLIGQLRCDIVGADCRVLVSGVGHDVGYSPCQCFDWAVGCMCAVVPYTLPTFSIFLI